jgi:hypothetical protein
MIPSFLTADELADLWLRPKHVDGQFRVGDKSVCCARRARRGIKPFPPLSKTRNTVSHHTGQTLQPPTATSIWRWRLAVCQEKLSPQQINSRVAQC